MLDLSNASQAEVREALGSGFPKHPLHKIACIGAYAFSVNDRPDRGWIFCQEFTGASPLEVSPADLSRSYIRRSSSPMT